MNKSLLVASFAVLTASVFGTPLERGNSSNNPLLREIKQEHPNIENTEMQNPQENSQSNEINGNNLISLMLKILSENDIFKSEIRDKDAEIQKLTQEKDAKIQELRDKLSFMQQRLIKANNNVFNKFYEKNPRKRSRSVGEEEIQRELNSNKLRNVISQNNETISEYRKRQKSLESENQKLTESNQEKDKTITDLENDKRDLKQKLDEVNQKLEKQKTKKLKVFEGEILNTVENPEIDLSKYDSFPNLKKLIIRADQLSDILRNKPDLSKVTDLDLHDSVKNPLDSIELVLVNLLSLIKNVKTLDLRSNSLIFLSKKIGNLQNLKYLYLAHNKLTELPKEIGNLKNLKALTLNNNSLTAIPEEIGNLQNLEYLSINNNNLTRIPAEICALPNLKELDIRNNPLEKLSREMFVFSNIKIHQ